MSEDPRVARALDEARKCEQRGEHAEALDCYEEIVRLGAETPEILTAMGGCYMRTRQRQNARQCWLRAFEKNPNHKPAVEQLDRYFQGWEKTISVTPPHKADSPPPPPPAPHGASASDRTKLSISFESAPPAERTPPRRPSDETYITEEDIFGGALERPQPPPPRPAPGRPSGEPFRNPFDKPAGRPMPSRPAPQRPVPAAAGRASQGYGEELPPVNWDFIMADAIVEAERRH
jgi:hypothetical protein